MNSILSTPLVWMVLTLTAYEGGFWLHKKLKEPVLMPPMLLSLIMLIGVLLAANVNYQQYFEGNAFIHFLLGTSTVALAVPLYQSLPRLKAAFMPKKFMHRWH